MPEKFDTPCAGCPYENAKHLPVVPLGRTASPLSMEGKKGKILLILQSPGVNEWESGKPLWSNKPSSAGNRLAAAFQTLGKIREDFNITNTVQCFPGKKEGPQGKRHRDKFPSAAASRYCAEWLRRDIEAHDYKKIVVFGAPAKLAVKKLGYANDKNFVFVTHPTGGLSEKQLLEALA